MGYTPEEILPDGDDFTLAVNPFTGYPGKARKGTVAATLKNIAVLNQALLLDSQIGFEQVQETKEAITSLIASLKAIGIFDLFSIDEWLSDTLHAGRIYVAVLYLKQFPEDISDSVLFKLELIREKTKSKLLYSEIEMLIH